MVLDMRSDKPAGTIQQIGGVAKQLEVLRVELVLRSEEQVGVVFGDKCGEMRSHYRLSHGVPVEAVLRPDDNIDGRAGRSLRQFILILIVFRWRLNEPYAKWVFE